MEQAASIMRIGIYYNVFIWPLFISHGLKYPCEHQNTCFLTENLVFY